MCDLYFVFSTETRLVRDVALSPIASLKCLHTLTLVGVPGIEHLFLKCLHTLPFVGVPGI